MKNLLCYGFLFLSLSLNAQSSGNPMPNPFNLDTNLPVKEVRVYGKGIASNYNDRTSSIQLINMVQNRDLPIRSVNEALSFVPGLDLRQRGVQGIQGDLSIRGGGFDQNLILINGFKLVDIRTI